MVVSDPLRPTVQVAHTWQLGTNPDDWQDDVVQPNAGNGDYIGAFWANGDDDDIEIVGFGTLENVDEVTNITVWTYGETYHTLYQPWVSINMGGWESYVQLTLGIGMLNPAWESTSFNGSWSQSDLDGLQVGYRAEISDIQKGPDANRIDVCYVIVTYTEVSGYGHKVLGVATANIAKVNGVATANIAKVNGV